MARVPGRWLGYEEAIEEALCVGWVDGLVKRLDEDFRAIRFTPRKKDSVWSEPNKRRVRKLVREGRMTAAGLALVKHAKRSGEWAAARGGEAVRYASPADRRPGGSLGAGGAEVLAAWPAASACAAARGWVRSRPRGAARLRPSRAAPRPGRTVAPPGSRPVAGGIPAAPAPAHARELTRERARGGEPAVEAAGLRPGPRPRPPGR